MDNQVPNEQTEEKKTERIDELDVIGGGILKVIIGLFERIRRSFGPKNQNQ